MESMERVILSLDARDIILKQLAFQNVSPTCQSLLRQIRKSGSISDYIKASAEVSPSYLQGVAKATVLQRQISTQFLTKQDRDKSNQGSMDPRCYLCGQTGHASKFCSLKRGNIVSPNTSALTQDTNHKVPLTLCPCCQNDYHWKKDCQSYFHRDGTPLPDASASPLKENLWFFGETG